MKEYIERAVALEALSKSGVTCNMRAHKIVASIQAADVAPVVHGRWIGYDASYYRNYTYGAHPVNLIRYKCSVCGRTVSKKEPYCHCGAKMDGGNQDE